jgi:hypothetical protein
MNVPEAIRGTEGQGTPPAADATASEGIPTGSSRDGVTTAASRFAGSPPPVGRVPRRWSAKWFVAAAVLAMMVFGITIALQLMGPGTRGTEVVEGGGSTQRLELRFATTKQPPAPEGVDAKQPVLDVESHREGWADFWFVNENDQPVTIGLRDTSCKCSGAQVFVLPTGSKMEPGQEAKLEKAATAKALVLGSDEGMPVWPGQVGWVRLQWTGEAKKDTFAVMLWLNSPETGPYPKLEAFVKFHDPFMIAGVDPLGQIHASKLKQPLELPIICASVTRADMKLTTEVIGSRQGAIEPLVVGEPQRIDEKEYPDLAKRFRREDTSPDLKLRSAYRIPVKLRGQSDSGKPIDGGPFRRRVEVTLDSVPQSQTVEIQAHILGDVEVFGLTGNKVDFSSFPAKKGSVDRFLTLQSNGGAKKLEVDKSRTAEFLEVDLKEQDQTGAAPTWQMTVRVRPGAVLGRFPREAPAEYRDCAIYVRPVGVKDARATRIPVEGSATTE